MINISMKQKRGDGFTIVELMVATAVFAGVLLLAIVGFVQVGRLFYKGVSVSQTRQTASQIMDAITSDIRLSTDGANSGPGMQNSAGGSASPFPQYCIGNHLYTYNPAPNNPLNLSQHDFSTNFGLIQSQLPSGLCPSQQITSNQLVNPVEMLGDNMRLSLLDIEPTQGSTSSYQVNLIVTFGDNAVLNNPTSQDPKNPPTCQGIVTGSQFCSVIVFSSTVSNLPSAGP